MAESKLPDMLPLKQCENCAYAVAIRDNRIECRRNPPVLITLRSHMVAQQNLGKLGPATVPVQKHEPVTMFAQVNPDWFCGEWIGKGQPN